MKYKMFNDTTTATTLAINNSTRCFDHLSGDQSDLPISVLTASASPFSLSPYSLLSSDSSSDINRTWNYETLANMRTNFIRTIFLTVYILLAPCHIKFLKLGDLSKVEKKKLQNNAFLTVYIFLLASCYIKFLKLQDLSKVEKKNFIITIFWQCTYSCCIK
jgi:hypothetical protein